MPDAKQPIAFAQFVDQSQLRIASFNQNDTTAAEDVAISVLLRLNKKNEQI